MSETSLGYKAHKTSTTPGQLAQGCPEFGGFDALCRFRALRLAPGTAAAPSLGGWVGGAAAEGSGGGPAGRLLLRRRFLFFFFRRCGAGAMPLTPSSQEATNTEGTRDCIVE